MTRHICVLGIDGSGKSTLAAALPAVLAAEMNLVAGSAGENFLVCGPDEDHLAPKFHPDGFPLSARLARRFRRLAKNAAGNRKLYPVFKLAQMIFQDSASDAIGRRYRAAAMVSDGNTLLSTTGRAANYRRPASDNAAESMPAPGAEDLCALFAHLLDHKPLPPESAAKLPPLGAARRIRTLSRLLGLNGVWLPDEVIFLDLSPRLALERIAGRRLKVDRHENEADLAQAREMYLKTLEAFCAYRAHQGGRTHRIEVDDLPPGETLRAAVEALRPGIAEARERAARDGQKSSVPLGTTTTKLTGSAIWAKVFNYRYLVRYLMAKCFQGAWREPLFVFSKLGRIFLKEGYSAGVMRIIYDQDEKRPGLMDRVFLNYALHRGVYDRLQILTRRIEPELEKRLGEGGGTVRIFTAPSGFAYDLFRPLEAIAKRSPEAVRRIELVAADLDPHGVLAAELEARAARLGISFRFLRGDITSNEMREKLRQRGPYDMALFVGLSSWLPKAPAIRHLRWLRDNMAPGALLVTDCFTAEAYALSGRYVGYKAHYYLRANYRALLDYCGFDGLGAAVESGRDQVNHVVIARPR